MTDQKNGQDINCEQAIEELDAFVRGELPAESMDRMQSHLDACGGCKRVAQYEQAFRKRLLQLGSENCPDKLRRKIIDLLTQLPTDGPE